MIFSWQVPQWKQLCHLVKENRLPHALLLIGPAGLGKRHLATELARLVLCQNRGADVYCGVCHACHLMQADSHPDFRLIQPEQEERAIKIEAIRELADFVHQTAHQGGARVVLIQPATSMNHAAANALLKTLEEPAPRTLLILVSDHRATLPLTVVSRCQQLRFTVPPREEALGWLRLQNQNISWEPILAATEGAPLLAQTWQQEAVWPLYESFMRDLTALTRQEADPFQLAVQWKDKNLLWLFDLFFQWLLKCLRLQECPQAVEEGYSPGVPLALPSATLLEFLDFIQRLRIEALGPYNLNQQLMLESLFIRWIQYVSC